MTQKSDNIPKTSSVELMLWEEVSQRLHRDHDFEHRIKYLESNLVPLILGSSQIGERNSWLASWRNLIARFRCHYWAREQR